MAKTYLILALLTIALSLQGQQPILDYAPMFGVSIFKGMLDGTIESMRFHPSQTAKLFGVRQDQIDPAMTWQNKYKDYSVNDQEKFFLSKSLLVMFTDPYHAVRAANNMTGLYLPVFYPRKQTNLDRYLIIPVTQFIGQAIGFTIIEYAVKKQ